jgi:hypothetical protein
VIACVIVICLLLQMIIVTPEKWDIITRKSGDRTYTQKVSGLTCIIPAVNQACQDDAPADSVS